MKKKTDKHGREIYELDNRICNVQISVTAKCWEPTICLEVIDPEGSATYDMNQQDARTLAAMLLRFADTGSFEEVKP